MSANERKRPRLAPPLAAAAENEAAAIVTSSTRFDVFKEWLLANGACWDEAVDFKRTEGLGLHVVATALVPANRRLLCLPANLCMHPNVARAHPCLGPAITSVVDGGGGGGGGGSVSKGPTTPLLGQADVDRALVYTLLLYEAAKGSASFWAPYVGSPRVASMFLLEVWYDRERERERGGHPCCRQQPCVHLPPRFSVCTNARHLHDLNASLGALMMSVSDTLLSSQRSKRYRHELQHAWESWGRRVLVTESSTPIPRQQQQQQYCTAHTWGR
jgi:hypothetical protein